MDAALQKESNALSAAQIKAEKRAQVRLRNRTKVDQRVAVFDSRDATGYSGDPRALYERFIADADFSDHHFFWVFAEPIARALSSRGFDVQGLEPSASSGGADADIDLDRAFGATALAQLSRATIVVRGSDASRRAYAQAGYWITNSFLPHYLSPRGCQTLVRFWNGIPVAGSAGQETSEPAAFGLDFDGRRLKYLVSQSGFATEKIAGALHLERDRKRRAVIETGLPRNDRLSVNDEARIAEIRERLGISVDRPVVFYHPVNSEGSSTAGGLDLSALAAALTAEWVVVTDGQVPFESSGDARIIAASDITEPAELMVLCDVLVTGFSDLVFDFVATGKPVVFFDTDARRAEAWARQLYLSPQDLPGVVSSSADDLAQRVVEAHNASAPSSTYVKFIDRFAPDDDGGAAARVLGKVAFAEPAVVEPVPLLKRLRSRAKKRTKKQLKRFMFGLASESSYWRRLVNVLLGVKRRANYRGHVRREALDSKTVIFESFVGTKYSCSPRALYEQMLSDERYADWDFVWAFKRPVDYRDRPEMQRATVVRYGSQEYYRQHARAKYWISNSVVFPHMHLRPGQIYLQTWHGTPLKWLGCDIASHFRGESKLPVEEKHRWYQNEGRRFTYLLSQSPFASEKLASAFDLSPAAAAQKIIEEGYPRNDFLARATASDVERLRKQYDVEEGKKTILYAPTWRDDQHVAGVGYTLDLGVDFDALHAELGDDYVVLFRAHYLVAEGFEFERYQGFVKDVSYVDDITELYVISDLLITDYSSVFFDYSSLRRPMLFYMYDYKRYAEELRGLYLEPSELPGPVVREQPELVSAIRLALEGDDGWDERREEFARNFAGMDDGMASARVLDRIIERPDGSSRS